MAEKTTVAAPVDRMQQLEQDNEGLRARLGTLEKLLNAQQPVLQPIKLAQDRELEFRRKQAELSQSCQERTQGEAIRRWGAGCRDRYSVQVAEVPMIMIPARSREEAKGRYDELCGIIGVDSKHKYLIGEPVAA